MTKKAKSSLLRAYRVIEKLEAQLKATKEAQREPIAIVGMACRFPGGDGLESFWALLRDGLDATSEVPAERWDVDAYYDADREAPNKMYVRRGAFLSGVDRFDCQFFGISPREAKHMDPLARHMT